jgi:hypothetical protein
MAVSANKSFRTCKVCREKMLLGCFAVKGERVAGHVRLRKMVCRDCEKKRAKELSKEPDDFAPTDCKGCGAVGVCGWKMARCVECIKKIALANRLKKYDLTHDQYNRLLRFHDGCGICKAKTDLAIDHDHSTGAVRGLLCRSCNTGLGHFRDDPMLMERAIGYLIMRSKHNYL